MDGDPALAEFAREVERLGEGGLARAALALARMEYPDLDAGVYLRRLDELARRSGVARAGEPVGRLHRLREYLFGELGFAGNRDDYFDPANSFLNDVLERRLGIPITLSLVLIEVGRRVGLTIEGIGLPGHFVTGVGAGDARILLDPFNGGAVVTVEQCRALAGRALGRPVELTDAHLTPVDPRQFLTRMLANLKGIYCRREDWARVIRVIDRLLVVNPECLGELRDRGTARANLGETQRGLADWERYLHESPNAPDHDQILGQLRKVRQRLARLN
jgi:regulator of sirC expression with transglutaminase-like and TPR domain